MKLMITQVIGTAIHIGARDVVLGEARIHATDGESEFTFFDAPAKWQIGDRMEITLTKVSS